MRVLKSNELKKIQLDILIDFAKFCDKNNITYYLGGGTLLGAVRHKGFIPWDDDIDIMMPRDDFNRALELYCSKNYKFLYVSNCDIWTEQIAKVCDVRTYMYSDIYKNTDCNEINCIGIDVCPLDGLPDSFTNQKILFFITKIIIAIHSSSVLKLKSTNRFNDKDAGVFSYKKYLRNFFKYFFIMLFGWSNPRVWVDLLNFFVIKKSFYESKFVAGIVSCVHGEKEIMPKCVFARKVLVKFEDHEFWAPVGYDYYLRRLYGNYMVLPPINHRKPHHDFIAYIKE